MKSTTKDTRRITKFVAFIVYQKSSVTSEIMVSFIYSFIQFRLSWDDLAAATDPDKTKKKPKRKRSPSPEVRKQLKRKRYVHLISVEFVCTRLRYSWNWGFSTRGPSTPSTPLNSKKVKNEDDSSMDDLTKDLEEPVPEPNIQEVPVTKLGAFFHQSHPQRNIVAIKFVNFFQILSRGNSG